MQVAGQAAMGGERGRGGVAVGRGPHLAAAAADSGDELVDGGEGLEGDEGGDVDGAGVAHAAQVVAQQVHDHQVLRPVLLRRLGARNTHTGSSNHRGNL